MMPRASVMLDGKAYWLGRTEWRLLRLLLLARGEWLAREPLMDAIYEDDPDPPFSRIIYAMIDHIRRKFHGARLRIESRRGPEGGFCARMGSPTNG